MSGDTQHRKHKTEPPPLSVREIRFCQHYAETRNATRSYLDAGFVCASENSARSRAFRLLRKVNIRNYIRELQFAAADAAQVSVAIVAQALRRIALADRAKLFDSHGRLLPPDQWPADIAACVEGVESEELYEPTGEPGVRRLAGYARKVRTAKRMDALRLLAQWLRMVGQDADIGKETPKPLAIKGEADPDLL